MFEGYTALYPNEKKHAEYFFELCMQRKIILNPYLTSKYKYTQHSLYEVEGTAYVCLDTYAHIILGLLNLFQKYEN